MPASPPPNEPLSPPEYPPANSSDRPNPSFASPAVSATTLVAVDFKALNSPQNPAEATPILRSKDFGFLPIPRRLQWDDDPPPFTLALNLIFGFASTFTVASLYYVQPILPELALRFDVDYNEVVNLPTLLQAGYAVGLLLITPLGDLVRRRQLLLLLVTSASICTIILPFVPLIGFEVFSFLLGLVTVTPQILLPLAGDLAPPNKRAAALSIVLSGLLFGILFARLLAGLIANQAPLQVIWYMSFGLQMVILSSLYASVPDYPAKNPELTYFNIIWTMIKFSVTEPVLVQSCLVGGVSSAVFASFWVSSTFLLSDVYNYNSLEIGLFALIGIAGVSAAPFIGKGIDRLVGWYGVLLGISLVLLSQVIYIVAAGTSIVAFAFVILFLDIGQQTQQVSNSTRIFAINAAARSRLSAVYIFAIFCGQLVGTSGGTRVYLLGGYRAAGGLCLGLLGWMFTALYVRGPHLPIDRWFGHDGGWEWNRKRSDRKLQEKAEHEIGNEKVVAVV